MLNCRPMYVCIAVTFSWASELNYMYLFVDTFSAELIRIRTCFAMLSASHSCTSHDAFVTAEIPCHLAKHFRDKISICL